MNRIIKIWSTANGELVNSFIGHSSDINATALSECGTYLASCSNDGIVRIWHLESGVYRLFFSCYQILNFSIIDQLQFLKIMLVLFVHLISSVFLCIIKDKESLNEVWLQLLMMALSKFISKKILVNAFRNFSLLKI